VAVGVAEKRPVVVLVIFGEYPWGVENFEAGRQGRLVEGADMRSARRSEGDVELTFLGALSWAEPERSGLRPEESDGLPVFVTGGNAQRGEHDLVEGPADEDIVDLNCHEVEHGLRMALPEVLEAAIIGGRGKFG
jgi:hypothetical protein